MGTEFLPELGGRYLIFVEMPPSIALEAAQTSSRDPPAHPHVAGSQPSPF
jgi:hypothetical protein